MLIAHQRKNDGDRTPIGSIQYENQSRNVWNIKGSPDMADNHIIHLACTHTKANNTFLRRDPIGFCVNFGDKQITVQSEEAVVKSKNDGESLFEKIETLLMISSGPLTIDQIAASLERSEQTVRNKLNRGRKDGTFKKDGQLWSINMEQDEDNVNSI